eukprot:GFUD01021082.1.p1 GENE.GFUD01021082.1~~GFUD01021082.1.p1  ORF type:complete len:989 (+),score=143.59 GFUD01021082.1:2-2968(+)
MSSARPKVCVCIFLFVVHLETYNCEYNSSTKPTSKRIVFPSFHEDEESDFLTKLEKRRNDTNSQNLPFGNLQPDSSTRKYTNVTASKDTQSSTRRYKPTVATSPWLNREQTNNTNLPLDDLEATSAGTNVTTNKITKSITREFETTKIFSTPTKVTPSILLNDELVVVNPIRKCCRRGQILNKWHKCKNRKNVNKVFLEEIRSISDDSDASKYTRNSFKCPRRLINEYVPTDILADGSVVIEMDDANITTLDYHCIELTEIAVDVLDGLHVVMCNTEGMREDDGYISKCCENEMVLNEKLDKCVDLPAKISVRNWIPPRTILSSENWRPTGQYHIRNGLFPSICNGSAFMVVVPEQFTTDGEVSVMVDEEFTMTEYACADRVKLDDAEDVSDVVALICINKENVEIEKCCPEDKMFSLVKQHCVRAKKNEDIWSPYYQFDLSTEHIFHINTNFLSDYSDGAIDSCEDIYSLNPEESQAFLETDLSEVAELKGRYCIDNMYAEDGNHETLVVICHEDLPGSREGRTLDGVRSGFDDYLDEEVDPEPDSCDWTHLRNFFSFLGVVSILCLLATLYVYCTLPEFKSMHGKIVISNVTCTLMVNLFILLVYNNSPSSSGCIVLGYFGYFSNMAMFSWMTVMCFDLGWTFLKARVPHSSAESKKFLKYSAFGFGLPFLFSCFAALFQLSTSSESGFNPNIGRHRICFIHDAGNRQLVFFFLPILLLMIGNVVGFVFTLHLMRKAQKAVRSASISRRKNSTKKEKQVSLNKLPSKSNKLGIGANIDEVTKEQIVLYGRMFLVLGIPWIFESIHYLAHGNHEHMQNSCSSNGEIFFRFISILNLCRGVFLFFIFVCKKPIWKNVQKTKAFKHFPKKSFIRTEKKRRLENGQFMNQGFVKSGETNFSVLSVGSNFDNMEMVEIKKPSEIQPERMKLSKEKLGKSLDCMIVKAKDSKLAKHILNKCSKSKSLDLLNVQNVTMENPVILSSVTVHTDK